MGNSFRDIVFAKLAIWQFVLGAVFVAALFIFDLRKAGDFYVFYLGAVRYGLGAQVHLQESNAFTYPTFLAMLLSPLRYVGFDIGKILFFMISVFGMFCGIRLTNHHILSDAPHTHWIFWIGFITSIKYFLAVFQNQQSDLIVFFLVVVGVHYYSIGERGEKRSSIFLGLSVLVKTNPLFLILLPLFQKKYLVGVLMALVCITGITLSDLLRPNSQSSQDSFVEIPRSSSLLQNSNTQEKFATLPTESLLLAHLNDYLELTLKGKNKWWHDDENELNQSLTRILSSYLPDNWINPTWVFLFWCSAFALALLLLANKRDPDYFVLGLLFYSAFILIGPMSSKAHFIAMYGLLIYLWKDALCHSGKTAISKAKIFKIAQAVLISLIFGFTSKGLVGNFGDQLAQYGHIGLSSLYLWGYVYLQECFRDRSDF